MSYRDAQERLAAAIEDVGDDDPAVAAAMRSLHDLVSKRAHYEPIEEDDQAELPSYLESVLRQQRQAATQFAEGDQAVPAPEPEERPRLKARVDAAGNVNVEASNAEGQRVARTLGELLKAIQGQPLSPVGTAVFELAVHVAAIEFENNRLREELANG